MNAAHVQKLYMCAVQSSSFGTRMEFPMENGENIDSRANISFPAFTHFSSIRMKVSLRKDCITGDTGADHR
jgi:hypothetical protein